jgi:hypothetical protein
LLLSCSTLCMITGMRHSDEDLLEVMRYVASRNGGRCGMYAYDRMRLAGEVKIWPKTISDRFGSWDKALEAAGLPLNHRPGSTR